MKVGKKLIIVGDRVLFERDEEAEKPLSGLCLPVIRNKEWV
jgi:hypothetical protein